MTLVERVVEQAELFVKGGNFAEGHNTLSEFLHSLDPSTQQQECIDVLSADCAVLMAWKLPQLALGAAISAVLLSPTSWRAYYDIALAQMAMGLYKNAAIMLRRATALDELESHTESIEGATVRLDALVSAATEAKADQPLVTTNAVQFNFWFPPHCSTSSDLSFVHEQLQKLGAPVEIRHCAEGRGLFALKALPAGSVVFVEPAFASGTATSSVCALCLRNLPTPHVACSECQHEHYCSVSCRTRAWQTYHRKTCTGDDRIAQLRLYARSRLTKEDASSLMLVFRLAGIAQCLWEEKGLPPASLKPLQLPEIGMFGSLLDISDPDMRQRALTYQLAHLDERSNDFIRLHSLTSLDWRVFDFEWFWQMHMLIRPNAFSTLNGEGSGLYTIGCAINHSCAPNCSASEDASANGMIITTLRDIAEGEQLTISYQRQKPDRRQWLQRNFGFNCSCSQCSSNPEE
eukprot:TRINITY_DN7242_c0_g1_i1.p1 TRINITY_DN7242_c0_g1~~TRINITY_DN7242_c0_g1_i1.p1  ORF type:complete len:461 (-),score=63.69 TRINITY_DN7242_c0_g1_i1:192-1574(-)